MEFFEENSRYTLHKVDGDGTVDQVHRRVLKELVDEKMLGKDEVTK